MHSSAGWHLDHVEVIDDATGEDFFFPCGMWFDRTEGDKQIDRILKVAVRDMTVSGTGTGPVQIPVIRSSLGGSGKGLRV